MYHLIENFTNAKGDALAGYYVKLKVPGGAYASIFADVSGTPIVSVSGVADTAQTDNTGQFDLYVADGDYDIEFFDAADINQRVRTIAAVPMFGNVTAGDISAAVVAAEAAQAAAVAAAADADGVRSEIAAPTGGARVGLTKGNVAQAIKTFTPEMFLEGSEEVGDGAADSQPVLQRAIDYIASIGGGDLVVPAGIYDLGKPLEGETGVNIVGLGVGHDAGANLEGPVFRKTNATVSDTTSVDCVVCFNGKRDFTFKNIMVAGNRTSASDVPTILAGNAIVTASSAGIYAVDCETFNIANVRSYMNQIGFKLESSYSGTINTCKAILCEGYGWDLSASCTSLTFNACGSYACGGHASISGCVYITWNSPFSDLIDRGGLPFGDGSDITKDPFAAAGTFRSGGQYNAPAYVWNLSGSKGIAVNASGQEGGYSQWLYAEGTFATFNNPYSTVWKAENASWRWVQTRGTGRSVITINGQYGFDDTIRATAAAAVFIETPELQRLFINGKVRLDNFNLSTDYSTSGIVHADQRKPVDITQATMQIGGIAPFLKPAAGDTAAFDYTSGIKRLHLEATATGSSRFSIPLGVASGFFLLRAKGTAGSLADLVTRFRLSEYTAAGAFVQDIHAFGAVVGATFDIAEWAFAVVGTGGNNLRLDVPMLDAAEDIYAEKIELFYIPNQADNA